MADFLTSETLNLDFLKMAKVSFDIVGNAQDGARNGLGQSLSMDTSGGGIVTASIENCFVHHPEEFEYISWVAAHCNGSTRFINVSIWNDWIGPFPTVDGIPQTVITGIPHSDGSLFNDGAGYSQNTVYATVTDNAALHATTISMQLFGAAKKLWLSGWFSIQHPTKGCRAYRYRKVVSGTLETPIYTLVFDPPLREAVTIGTSVEWVRPKCVMKFPAEFTLPWEIEGFQRASPSMKFVEAS